MCCRAPGWTVQRVFGKQHQRQFGQLPANAPALWSLEWPEFAGLRRLRPHLHPLNFRVRPCAEELRLAFFL
jgi:hypothetical protein